MSRGTTTSPLKIPYNALLGIRLERVHRDGVTVACTVRDDLRNSTGAVHGGVAPALADAAMGIALMRRVRGRRHATTIELKVNYLRPVTEGSIFARSRLLRVGSRISVGSVELTDSNSRLVGAAIVTYMFLDSRSAAPGENGARRVSKDRKQCQHHS